MNARIDDKSRVPIAWIFVLLSCSGSALLVAVGVGLYAGRIEGQANASTSAVIEIRALQNERDSVLRVIDERLSRIEGAVGVPVGKSIVPRRK